jgi:hypothetical protein
MLDRRREFEILQLRAGMSSAIARRIVEVEDWLADATADLRMRATAARTDGPRPTPPPRPPTAGATLVRTTYGPARLERDSLSGKGLSGYAIVGLAYRHVGVQRRTVTRIYRWSDGRAATVVSEQHRGVFTVEPGLGWENMAVVRFAPRTWYDPWRE